MVFVCVQVVPLAPKAGLVEWCQNTRVLGDYLIGRTSKYAAVPSPLAVLFEFLVFDSGRSKTDASQVA